MVCLLISALLMGLLSLVKSSQTVNISAQPGENVTIWCKHIAGVGKHIHWFKQTHGAVPLGILYKMLPYNIEVNATYLNHFAPDHFVMSVNRKNTSLSILNIDITDSGLYFCGWCTWKIVFGDEVHLDIKDLKSEILTKDCPGNIFYNLTFIFGGIIVVFIISLTLGIIKIIRTLEKDANRHVTHHEEAHSSVYAALRFSKQKTRSAAGHNEDTKVVYSATR
nr:uncharacterized protein LOC110438756 [Danio rerio]|eukprot:XP_021327542.1 uncharacterized protein LOC110438756 [Danio rerio]